MRALHPDVLLATSAIWQTNCAVVRGAVDAGGPPQEGTASRQTHSQERESGGEGARRPSSSTLPVLPEELEALPALLEQARFPAPSGLLATHADWDHLLGRLAFPGVALGCAQSTAERMHAAPGEAQRELRAFDEQYLIERPPLALGAVQALPVPGRCAIGELRARAASHRGSHRGWNGHKGSVGERAAHRRLSSRPPRSPPLARLPTRCALI